MLAALRERGELQRGDALQTVGCFRHEQPNNWEKAKMQTSVANACRAYHHAVVLMLRKEGLNVTSSICTRPMVHDFVLLALAPVVLSGTSSFSFVGFFGQAGSRRAFLTASKLIEHRSPCGNSATCKRQVSPISHGAARMCGAACEQRADGWLIESRHILRHAEVRDYLEVPAVLALLHSPPPDRAEITHGLSMHGTAPLQPLYIRSPK
eukprot:CAMPEP_0119339176 /NCGR_PEP_ID=MMETSP1333-20130426/97725_1 /TAXON_ID=418940 /ORGANISM="Scyphosphaera apsteinii, Strain RCC1455" /LENGTH=208 /DNA_ID=CAMNT_0007350661 /DNA_START=577 /DNA_END=1203 /DNA_ORIENTATION=-